MSLLFGSGPAWLPTAGLGWLPAHRPGREITNSIIDGPPDTNIHPSLMGQPTSADREYSSEIHGSAGVGQDDIFNRAFKKH